jgi:hypothetical protein
VCASSTLPCPANGHPANPVRAARRCHWRQSRRTQGPAVRITPLRRPPPSRAPTSAHRSAHLSHPAATSPEQSLPRPARDSATESRRQAPLRSNFDPKPARGKPRTIFHPSPILPGKLLAGILAGAAGHHAQGPNCKQPAFSRVVFANQGYPCEESKVPGACLKVCFLNSV